MMSYSSAAHMLCTCIMSNACVIANGIAVAAPHCSTSMQTAEQHAQRATTLASMLSCVSTADLLVVARRQANVTL
jgi:hypothetical protein